MSAFLMNNLVKLGLLEHQLVASALDDLLNLIKSVSYSFAIELMDVVNDSEVIIVGSHVLAIGLPHDLVFVFQLLTISIKLCFDEITIDFTFLIWSVWIDRLTSSVTPSCLALFAILSFNLDSCESSFYFRF